MGYHKRFIQFIIIILLAFLYGCSNKDKAVDESNAQNVISEKIERANILLRKGESEEAIKILEDLQEEYPQNPKILEAIAFAYSDLGDPTLSAFYFEQIIVNHPTLLEYRIFAAQAYEEIKDWEQAARNYSLYLENYPLDPNSWKKLGHAYENDGKIQKAINAYQKSLDLKKDNAEASDYAKMGNLLEKTGELDSAKIWYYKTLKKDPQNKDILLTLLKIETQDQNYPLAEKHLNALEKMELNSVDAFFISSAREKIREWKQTKEYEESIPDEDEIEMPVDEDFITEEEFNSFENPQDTDTFHKDSEAPTHKEEIAEDSTDSLFTEENESQIIVTEEPKKETPKIKIPKKEKPTLAQIIDQAKKHKEAGEYNQAIDLYWQAITQDPNKAQYWYDLGMTFYETKDAANAEMALLEALRREPDNRRYTLGYLKALQLGHPSKLIKELQKAHTKYPDSPEITYALAKTYQRLEKNSSKSKYYYNQFIKRFPNHPKTAEVKRTMTSL